MAGEEGEAAQLEPRLCCAAPEAAPENPCPTACKSKSRAGER